MKECSYLYTTMGGPHRITEDPACVSCTLPRFCSTLGLLGTQKLKSSNISPMWPIATKTLNSGNRTYDFSRFVRTALYLSELCLRNSCPHFLVDIHEYSYLSFSEGIFSLSVPNDMNVIMIFQFPDVNNLLLERTETM